MNARSAIVGMLSIGMLSICCGLQISSCSGVKGASDADLQNVVEVFHHDLRWQYYDRAASQVDPRFSSAFLDELDEGKGDLHITGWEVRHVEFSPDRLQARIRVKVSYYRMPSTVVHEDVVEQEWKFVGGRWSLSSLTGGPLRFPPQSEDQKNETDDQER